MSECPDCDETGIDYDGDGQPFPCRNWRHRSRPTLEQIADCLKRGIEPPRPYMLPENPNGRGEERAAIQERTE